MSATKHQSVSRADDENATVVDLDSPDDTPSSTPSTRTPSHRHRHEDEHDQRPSAEQSEEEKIIALQHTKGLNWTHVKLMLVAGSGCMCDAYDLQVIGIVTTTIGRLYFPDWTYFSPEQCAATGGVNPVGDAPTVTVCGSHYARIAQHGDQAYKYIPSAIPNGPSSALQAVALCGTLAGQLVFGWLGDKLGRQSMFQVSLLIMVMFAILQAFSFGSTPIAVMTSLCLFRFMLGVGIGGDYPLSATLMAEYSSRWNRGMLVAAVFAMQGTGYLLADCWALITSAIWEATDSDPDTLWRTVLIFAAVPTGATIYARRHLPETPVYLAQQRAQRTGQSADVEAVTTDEEQDWTYGDFFRQHWLLLIGTAGSWFFLDTSYYSTNLLQSTVYSSAGWVPAAYTMTAAQEVQRNARAQLYTTLAGLIPGYWLTVLTIEKLGRFNIQLIGFTMLTILLAILAGLYNQLSVAPFIALFVLTFFFSNFGPNATTFVYPVEVFTTKYRSFGHGFSAAAGKSGSIVGTFAFATLANNGSLQTALGLLAAFAFAGFCCTWCLPETKQLSLKQASEHALINTHQGSVKSLFNYPSKYVEPEPDTNEETEQRSMKRQPSGMKGEPQYSKEQV